MDFWSKKIEMTHFFLKQITNLWRKHIVWYSTLLSHRSWKYYIQNIPCLWKLCWTKSSWNKFPSFPCHFWFCANGCWRCSTARIKKGKFKRVKFNDTKNQICSSLTSGYLLIQSGNCHVISPSPNLLTLHVSFNSDPAGITCSATLGINSISPLNIWASFSLIFTTRIVNSTTLMRWSIL